MEKEDMKKILEFTIKEKEIIKTLNLPEEVFLPLFFSVRFGGDWSVKQKSKSLMSVKEKITEYNEKTKIGYTLEKIYLFVNPEVLDETGKIYRMEKCGNKNERELVERPYSTTVDGEYILEATLNPKEMKITVKHLQEPLTFFGPAAYGTSHEIEHLKDGDTHGIPFWDFEYVLE